MKSTITILALLTSVLLFQSCRNRTDSSVSDTVPQTAPGEALSSSYSDRDLELFHAAALNGDMELLSSGLEKGIPVDLPDADQRTALMYASYNGHSPLVSLLLEKGAEVNLRDAEARTALMFASTGDFQETIILLLDAGAGIDLVDREEHFSALMFAAAEGQAGVVGLLLERGANKDLEDIDGETAYDFALNGGHQAAAALLR